MNNSTTYTALDLLDKVIEFTKMTPNSKEWSFKAQLNNPPRLVRLQQVQALMEAIVPELKSSYDIGQRIEDFYIGAFISQRPVRMYASLIRRIEKTIARSPMGGDKNRELSVYHLQDNYRNLLNYYLDLTKLIRHNSGMMEISYPYYFPYIVTNSISDSINSKVRTLARLLVLFIDPRKQSYTEDELIKGFNYPTEDLIDLDWM